MDSAHHEHHGKLKEMERTMRSNQQQNYETAVPQEGDQSVVQSLRAAKLKAKLPDDTLRKAHGTK